MSRLITKYEDPKTKKKSYRCIAPDCGETRAGNAAFDRVLKHATACKHLEKFSPEAYHDALAQSGQSSLGAQLDETSHRLPHGQTSLDMVPIRDQGKKIKEDAHQLFQAKVDHIIMRLICVRGLIPNLIDSTEWKELMHVLNGNYKPTSGDTFADKHIPREANYVREKQIEILRRIDNLTLTFDGNTTRKPHAIYTAHATTPSRASYFLDGHEGSDEHHNTQWVKGKLLKVCNKLYINNLCLNSVLDDSIGRQKELVGHLF